jgi:hypothetical protein
LNTNIVEYFMTENEQELFKQAEADLRTSPANITEKSFIVASLRLKWWKVLFAAQDELRQKKKERVGFIDAEIKKSGRVMIPRIQIEGLLASKPEVQEFDQRLDQLSNKVILLQGILKIFDEFGFTIKNSLDSLKLEKNL